MKILAGVEGVEPANAGIKIRCLNQLGDTPTRDSCQTFGLTANPLFKITHLATGNNRLTVILPTGQRMHLQIAALADFPVTH